MTYEELAAHLENRAAILEVHVRLKPGDAAFKSGLMGMIAAYCLSAALLRIAIEANEEPKP